MMEADDRWMCTVGSFPQHHDHYSDSEEQMQNNAVRHRSYSDEFDGRRSDYLVQHLNQDLIHRHPLHKEGEDPNSQQRQTIFHNGHSRPYQKQRPRRKKWVELKRIGVASIVIAYVWLMYRGLQMLQSHEIVTRDFPPGSRKVLYAAREQFSQMRWLNRQRMEGQRRTWPAMDVAELQPCDFALLDKVPRRDNAEKLDLGEPASLKELCGIHARNAAVLNSELFRSRDVLNSESRVLITGILNPIGLHLALTLKKRCGVEVIAGIDPMFPNTVENRIAMQERIQLLATNIPKLVQPVVLSRIGLDQRPTKGKDTDQGFLDATGEISLLNLKPTHIVHLASYSASEFNKGQFVNTHSPYGGQSDLYQIRSNAVAMEHILASLVSASADTDRPHFSYASSVSVASSFDTHDSCKLTDEILANTYYNMNRTFSVAMRLPNAVFGPWDRPQTSVHQIAEAAIQQWGRSPDTLLNRTDGSYDFSFVDNVVDAIIASMQYRSPMPAIFDLSSDSTHKLSTVASLIKEMLPGGSVQTNLTLERSRVPTNPLKQLTRDLLQWKPETSLQTGLAKTMAWHLDHAFPFGANTTTSETGDKFRTRLKIDTCSSDDLLCHLGATYIPCSSECSTRQNCKPSIFDSIQFVTREVSQGCDIVLYTQSLGYNVRDLKLHTTYSEEEEVSICNFAFVPKLSHLVHAAVAKVPEEQLEGFGIKLNPGEAADLNSFHTRKLNGLNGRLLYKGWILMWVDEGIDELSVFDSSLLKISPGSFFSSDVKHALFVDENFAISPSTEDVLFLVSQSHRPKIPIRNAWRVEVDGKKHKYRLPAEPERRAVLMLSPLRKGKVHDPSKNTNYHSLTVYEATKYMQVENGEDIDAKETQGVKKQREFYERVSTYVNQVDMRSPDEPWYRYDMHHWTRSKWIVHNLKLEEAKRLRCEWYQEHVQWGNNLVPLSFAYIMAKRDLARRIAHKEPDDHIKPASVLHPELRQLTDSHEWHAMESEENRLANINPMEALAEVPANMIDEDEKEEAVTTLQGLSVHESIPKKHDKAVPLFVRIISEQVMMHERQSWSVGYGNYKAGKKKSRTRKKE